MRMCTCFSFVLILQGLDSRSNPFQEREDDTGQMAILSFGDIFGGQHLEAQELVTSMIQEHAWRTRFERNSKPSRVWKTTWSI